MTNPLLVNFEDDVMDFLQQYSDFRQEPVEVLVEELVVIAIMVGFHHVEQLSEEERSALQDEAFRDLLGDDE